MNEEASALGRYATPTSASTMATVRLLGVPVRILQAGREHHDSLLREFRLLALARDTGSAVPARLAELTQLLGVRYSAARNRPDAEVDAALDRADDTVDLTYELPADPALLDGLLEISRLLSAADEFCRSEELLALERSPNLCAFTDWYLTQFVTQIGGGQPQRWQGPFDP